MNYELMFKNYLMYMLGMSEKDAELKAHEILYINSGR